MTTIGQEIRRVRREQDKTQAKFSELCGWSQREQSRYESNKTLPSKERLAIISEKLDKQWVLI